mgnify:CR=1 FL=1
MAVTGWDKLTRKLEPLAGKLILIGAGVPSAFLFLYSLIFTTVYESNDLEAPSQVTDPVPLILLFLAFRKKIMEGVSQGGTKG